MYSDKRELEYSLAINEALHQLLAKYKDITLLGQGVKSPWYVGNTCKGLIEKFDEERIIDTPVSENAMTGMAVGAAIYGSRAIVVHPRIDFMLYAFDPIVNQAANWHYMSGGELNVPVVFWGIINRGGEQAAQHSQALHSMFAHVPGLKVVMPSNAYDAKGLFVASVLDPNPVVFIDDRVLYRNKCIVPEELYQVEIGKAKVASRGTDLSIITLSSGVESALNVKKRIAKKGISVEVIDLRSIKPLDRETILKSVSKTGRALIVDVGWISFGVSAEITAVIAESDVKLKQPVKRIALADAPAPASRTLEAAYYIDEDKLFTQVFKYFKK